MEYMDMDFHEIPRVELSKEGTEGIFGGAGGGNQCIACL
jgi:hypothetical protein